jgi:hypothetical protein
MPKIPGATRTIGEEAATVAGTTRTVAEWLNWRREVSEPERLHLQRLHSSIVRNREEMFKKGLKVTDSPSGEKGEVVVHLKESELIAKIEQMEAVLGELDGKLSLINATTTIEI